MLSSSVKFTYRTFVKITEKNYDLGTVYLVDLLSNGIIYLLNTIFHFIYSPFRFDINIYNLSIVVPYKLRLKIIYCLKYGGPYAKCFVNCLAQMWRHLPFCRYPTRWLPRFTECHRVKSDFKRESLADIHTEEFPCSS